MPRPAPVPVEKIPRGGAVMHADRGFRRLIFGPAVPTAELVQANICYNAIYPGIEAALKTEAGQILINFQERFLIDVAGVFRPVQNVQGDPQYVAS